VKIWASLRSRPSQPEFWNPTVSILVVAHNEAGRICQRIENLLALDYEAGRLDIVIASDASTDATVALSQAYASSGVRVEAFDAHRGKPAVLNQLIPGLKGEIVVLMDVRQQVSPDAVRMLVDDFSDPAVGAVSGELLLTEGGVGEEGLQGVGFYWRYEKFIRLNESLIDSTVGVTGALYAIRRELFEPIPDDTILDDVLIPMHIVRKGYRVLFEAAAQAHDVLSSNARMGFRRKVRTIAGNFQLVCRNRWLLNPFSNRLWFQTISHKLLRLLGPVFLLLMLLANLFLLDQPLYQLTVALQSLFYLSALVGQMLPEVARGRAWLSVPQTFCLLNWSTAVGFYRFVTKQQRVTWASTPGSETLFRTARQGVPESSTD
jgi:cellulose synthase/poly-beta-1,6-N-acetylglucosamine synthase-like glycosyltransferase